MYIKLLCSPDTTALTWVWNHFIHSYLPGCINVSTSVGNVACLVVAK